MDWTVWALYVLTDGVLILMPGPAVILVTSRALQSGHGAALEAALGILSVNLGYFLVSATGVGALLLSAEPLFGFIRWGGAAYLAYLGCRAILRPAVAPPPGSHPSPATGIRPFLSGAVLQLSNPKALLFFVAILPPFIDTDGPVALQFVILGATSVTLEFAVLAMYGAVGSRLAAQRSLATALVRGTGILLIAIAGGLLGYGR